MDRLKELRFIGNLTCCVCGINCDLKQFQHNFKNDFYYYCGECLEKSEEEEEEEEEENV